MTTSVYMTNSCTYNQITHPRQIVPVTYQTMLVNRDPALAVVKRFPDFFHTQIIPLTEHAARLHHHAIQSRYIYAGPAEAARRSLRSHRAGCMLWSVCLVSVQSDLSRTRGKHEGNTSKHRWIYGEIY